MSILTFPQNSWEVQTDVVLRVHSPHSVCAMVKSGILACPAKMFFQPVLLKNKCWSENFNICPYHIVIELGYPYSLKISWCLFNLHIFYFSPWKLERMFQLVAITVKISSAMMPSFCLNVDEAFPLSEATFHYLQRKNHTSCTSAALQ